MTQEAGVPTDFWGRIQKMIEDAVAKLARSGMLRNASISGGGSALTVKEGATLQVKYPVSQGGGIGVYFGDVSSGGSYLGTGLLVQGPDGRDVASFRSDLGTGVTIATIRDGQENSVFYSNNATGEGLGRPWLPGGFYLARNTDWPVVTSGTFETVYRAKLSKQHTKLLVRVWGANDTGGATGEIRVMVNGVQLGATASTSSGVVAESLLYDTVAGAWGSSLAVEIQARLASGAGGVQVGASECTGRN